MIIPKAHIDEWFAPRFGSSHLAGEGPGGFRPLNAPSGSERRETVRSLSVVGVGNLRRTGTSTRGPCWTNRWCMSCFARSIAQ